MIDQIQFIGRSLRPDGHSGVTVGIPAEIVRELGLEAGKDGDLVDMEYTRSELTLTIHLPEPESPPPAIEQARRTAAD